MMALDLEIVKEPLKVLDSVFLRALLMGWAWVCGKEQM